MYNANMNKLPSYLYPHELSMYYRVVTIKKSTQMKTWCSYFSLRVAGGHVKLSMALTLKKTENK